MHYVELIVNVPIRRTFSRRLAEAAPVAPGFLGLGDAPPDDETDEPPAPTFHYHLPPDLEGRVQPGHLVWAPFGPRQVQGIVVALAAHAPVATRPITRLARPEPVLTPVQLALAAWIAENYVAPPVEALKLFLPPGLLAKEEGDVRVRAKREERIRWLAGDLELDAVLARLGRTTPQAEVLAWLAAQPEQRVTGTVLKQVHGESGARAVAALVKKGLVRRSDGEVALAVAADAVQTALYALRGVDRYIPLVTTLAAAAGPIWKSDLSAQVETDLATLRMLQNAGLIALDQEVRFRDPLAGRSYARTTPPSLTGEQAAAWAQIEAAIQAQLGASGDRERADTARTFLVHGVTGSGKTELYLRAIECTLALGRQAVVLVPEIALTPQTVARFAGRFPGRVTVIHSGLSTGERYDVWRAVRNGAYDIVVGPRSALFAPLARLGLVVVDEEHEPSYKQDAEVWGSYKAFYDARRTARRLAELVHGVAILGSATPSLESYFAAQAGEMTLLSLAQRVVGHGDAAGVDAAEAALAGAGTPVRYGEMPPVEVVDMRLELRAGNRSVLSRALLAELHATVAAGRQAILFLNRRGSSTFVNCRDCGAVERCPRCDIPLTYHERVEQLVCHQCNRRYPIPTVCAQCNSKRIRYFGSGTQRIEDLVQEYLPQARVLRWDADTVGPRGSHEEILRRFADREADVLVGTQMIAKGLDLPLVTLVGVVAADVGLYLPDFRAGERTFQLLTQVAGRAGRSRYGGRVVIQTYTPDHYVIQAAARHDYAAFYRRELDYRREHSYPPLRRMARLVYWEKNMAKADDAAASMHAVVRARLAVLGLGGDRATLIGPVPPFFARVRGYYRRQLLLLTDDPAQVLRGVTVPFGWRVDIDPATTL